MLADLFGVLEGPGGVSEVAGCVALRVRGRLDAIPEAVELPPRPRLLHHLVAFRLHGVHAAGSGRTLRASLSCCFQRAAALLGADRLHGAGRPRELHGHPHGFLRAPAPAGRSPHDRPFGFVRAFVRAHGHGGEISPLLLKRVGDPRVGSLESSILYLLTSL